MLQLFSIYQRNLAYLLKVDLNRARPHLPIDLGNAENERRIGPLEVLGVVRTEVVAEQAVKADQLLELDLVEESFQTVFALERVQCLELDLQLAYDGIDHLFLEGAPLCEVRRQLLESGSLLLD